MKRKGAVCALLAAPVVVGLAGEAQQPTAKPLQVTETIDVYGGDIVPSAAKGSVQSFAFLGSSRCDADGNLFLIPVPAAGSGRSRDAVRRIAANGMTTMFDLPTSLGLGAKEAAHINAAALDPSGNLYLLGVIGADAVGQSIISFDNNGQYRWKRDLDEAMLYVNRLAPFNTGEFLLVGQDPKTSAVGMAVMDKDGALHEVRAPFAVRADGSLRIHAESGQDGRVYVAQDGQTTVYAISVTGEVSRPIELVPPPKESAALLSLYLSGGRLAAIHEEKSDESATLTRWIVVQDASTGEHVATYGPLRKKLACYRFIGGVDQFTMLSVLGGKWQLLIESAP